MKFGLSSDQKKLHGSYQDKLFINNAGLVEIVIFSLRRKWQAHGKFLAAQLKQLPLHYKNECGVSLRKQCHRCLPIHWL